MSYRDVLRLAFEADIAVNSAKKALREGPHALRGRAGEKAAEAMARIGLAASASPSSPPPRAA